MIRLLSWLFVLLFSARASAEVGRFAVVIGNDVGASHEQRLQYAETDAERVYGALRDLGNFRPADMVLLRGEDADTVRSTLITLNDRLREGALQAGRESLLVVYYSGHADGEAMHLGDTRLRFEEMLKLVRGSSAAMRLLVVDACRSGALTRVKGGKAVPAFALPAEQEASLGEGFALLTASTATEDAQESDALGASFFTHALVSGLRGAADENGDARVMLDELYQHAYAATLRASSQSAHGTQHPTFQYEVRGRESVVLADLSRARSDQGRLQLPAGIGFLVLRDTAHGQVAAEVPEQATARILSLPGGRYFVRGRTRDALLEGRVQVAPGRTVVLDSAQLTRVAYARLVRKGGDAQLAHGPFAALTVRSALPGAADACLGAALGYAFHLRHLSVLPRLDWCKSGFANRHLDATTHEYALGVAALVTRDVSRLSLSIGLALSAQLTQQRFQTVGRAPQRVSLAPSSALIAMLGYDLGRGLQLGLEARGETYLLQLHDAERAAAKWDAAFAVRGGLSLGTLF